MIKGFKKFLQEKKQVIKVFYHLDADGYGSAYAAWLHFGNDAKYYKVNYGYKLYVDKGDIVYMVDYSTKRSEMIKICEKASKVIVIDHHKTAKDELMWNGAPDNLEVNYNKFKSGAVLAWEYFHSSRPPKIFDYIQDYDLWKFKYPETTQVNLWLDKNLIKPKDKDFKFLGKLPPMNVIFKEGSILKDQQDEDVSKALKRTEVKYVDGYEVGVVYMNSYDNINEIGNALAKEYTFGIVYHQDSKDKDSWKYALRSVGKFDVSEIAAKYGGGGHKNAAGITLPKSQPLWE